MQKNFCPVYKKYFLLLATPHVLFFSFIFHNHFLNSITTTSLIPHSSQLSQKKKETSSFPLFSPISPIQYNPSALPPIRYQSHLSSLYTPYFQPISLYSLSLTIPINSDIPTYTTNQKPFLLNSFVVIFLY